ncbi:MAG: YbfB/YjiJ family MFS transporter [Thermomicrobiales bacterium]|nr:YbfB/YjiJ family MFS transporter [Thermomicrobiales bacterium]
MTTRRATPAQVREVVLAGMLTMAVVMGIGRFAFTPILPAMRDAFGLSATDLGTLASANYLGYLLGALAAATPAVLRWRRQVMRGGLLLVVGVTAAMALTTSVPAWLVLRFVAGLASAGVFVFASAAVIGWFVQQSRPELVGFFFGGVGLGIASSGAMILLVQRLSGGPAWRAEWLGAALLGGLLAGPCLRWLPQETLSTAARPRPGSDRRAISWPMLLLAVSYFLGGVGYIVAGTFIVAIVGAVPGLEALGAGAWILVGLAAFPSTPVWTRVAARIGRMMTLGCSYLLLALSLLLPGLIAQPAAAVIATLLFGANFIAFGALTVAEAQALAPPQQAARTIALLTVIFGLGQVAGPLLAASLAGPGGDFRFSLVVAGLVVLGAALIALVSAFGPGRQGGRA